MYHTRHLTNAIFTTTVTAAAVIAFSFTSIGHAEWNAKKFKKPSATELKKKLTAIQFSVTQESDTERPFANPYWDLHDEGIFVDVVSGEPLFSSKDKYDSGTGWPSFSRPLVAANIETRSDKSTASERIEVRSAHAGSHLGHVFDDGPPPSGQRYCMNSAALRFIAKDKLQAEGYGEFAGQFSQSSGKKKLILAGGCFWSMERVFEDLNAEGILDVQSGYTGGHKDNPTYEQVSEGSTGHYEAVQITYDPKKISMERLLEVFWLNIDPFDASGEFCDKGPEYKSAIFTDGEDEKRIAEQSQEFVKKNAKEKGKIYTQILPVSRFFPAEDFHQNFHKKNAVRYQAYRVGCGRDKRSQEIWGDKYKH